MATQFTSGSFSEEDVSTNPLVDTETLRLLPQIEPWHRAFLGNLVDLLLFRDPPPIVLTSSPSNYWEDVFVERKFPKRGFRDSVLLHVVALIAVYGFTQMELRRNHLRLQSNVPNTRVSYYPQSENLPEINTGESAPKKTSSTKARPAPTAPADTVNAKQQIISVPPDPDNFRQTIATPSNLLVKTDIPLPNIVAAMPKLVMPMVVAQESNQIRTPKLTYQAPLPQITAETALPTLAQQPLQVRNGAPINPKLKDIAAPKLQVKSGMPEVHITPKLPQLAPQPTQVQMGGNMQSRVPESAAPNVAATRTGLPKLQTANSMPTLRPRIETESSRVAGNIASVPQPPPRIPDTPASGVTNGVTGGIGGEHKIVALNVNPTVAQGPIELPNGSRRGSFATGPAGTRDATASPATAPPSGETDGGSGRMGGSKESTLPPGLKISAAPDTSTHARTDNSPNSDKPNIDTRTATMRPSGTSVAHLTAPSELTKIEQKVFGTKPSYSLTTNMPNLSSTSGSWIIRFAELRPGADHTPLAVPVPVTKSDPAYPPDLRRDKVEGTVMLYAVIRGDGSITDVRVLNGVEDELDASAIRALRKWKFSPGSKNGAPVDVEAVVQVPFRLRKSAF